MLSRITRRLLLPCALAAAIAPASAYFDVDTDWGWHIRSQLTINAANESYRLAFEDSNTGAKKKKKSKKAQHDPRGYQYQYSAERSRENSRQYIEALIQAAREAGALTPETEQNLRAMADWDVIGTMRERIRANGFSPDSIAQAMAFWLQINYMTIQEAQGNDVETTDLLQQLERAMGKNNNLIRASDADKQQIAEQLLWMAFMQILVREDAQGDARKMHKAAAQARDNLQSMGIDADTMHVANGSLIIR